MFNRLGNQREGFTLVEAMIALTISGILLTVLIKAFFDTYIFSEEMSVRAALLEDSRVVMDSIEKDLLEGSVDYEEYFNQCVVKMNCPNAEDFVADENDMYGDLDGLYGWQFYDGGYYDPNNPDKSPDGAGALCQQPDGSGGYEVVRYPDPDCVSGVLSYSEDFNEGIFGGASASSICASSYKPVLNNDNADGTPNPLSSTSGNGLCSGGESNLFNELYLISKDGTKKTVYAKEKVSVDTESYAVSKLELVADNVSSESDIEIMTFSCSSNYSCDSDMRVDLYNRDSGEDITQNFIPISPLKVSVAELKFMIEPLEDPVKAFGEYADDVQIPPRVTVFMTLKASPEYRIFGLGEDYELKIQRTMVADIN